MLDRLEFSASVEIRAAAAEVFALVSDLRRKARLNPNIQVIRVELEGEGPVREGSVFYHRFQRGTRILEYRSRCVRFVPPRLFESRGETDPPFEVRMTVESTPLGCRVTQHEALEVPPDLLEALEPAPPGARTFRDLLGFLALFPGLRPLGAEVRALQRERLAKRLTAELEAWLNAIRAHVEAGGARAERTSV
ncbi:MAG: SRPBCC family protein [Candidatus Tectomicrobia bacterium]|nr:SRPBCC family protein [Candidatus Tectomicrobia bacterium]